MAGGADEIFVREVGDGADRLIGSAPPRIAEQLRRKKRRVLGSPVITMELRGAHLNPFLHELP